MFWEKFLQDLPFYILNLLAFAAVIAVTWLWARSRFFVELAQYQTKIAELQLQQNDKLFALEDDCKAKNERLRLILKELKNNLVFKKAEMVKARRNELSNVFVLDYCKAMQQYTRLASEMYQYDYNKRLQFIENHLNPFLQLADNLLTIANQSDVAEMLGTDYVEVKWDYTDFDFAFDFIRHRTKLMDFGARIPMRKYLKKLGFGKDLKGMNRG